MKKKKNAKKLITTKELAEISKIKINTIAKCVREGILQYTEEDDKLNRYYDKVKALQRLKEINRLKNEGVNLKGIKDYFNKQGSKKELKEVMNPIIERKPSVILKHRHKIKSQLERKLPPEDKYGTRGEAVVRDMARINSYPDINKEQKGVSSWFRVEVKGLYYNGLEVFIYAGEERYITFDNKKQEWRFAKDNERNKFPSFCVGRIPFENIREINWRGDEYYNCPHLYCNFKNSQPYESIIFYIEKGSNENKYLSLVQGFEPYK